MNEQRGLEKSAGQLTKLFGETEIKEASRFCSERLYDRAAGNEILQMGPAIWRGPTEY
jgi:hypothetical protein